MSTDIIKKCPFCGGEAEFHRTPVKSNGGWCDGVVVRCKVCEARTNRVLYDAKKHPNDEEYDEALKAWNTRKPLERVIERLEEEKRLADEEKERCAIANPLQFDSAKGYSNGIYNAIQIIKEEFNIDELQNGSETQHSETNCCNMEHIKQRFERVM